MYFFTNLWSKLSSLKSVLKDFSTNWFDVIAVHGINAFFCRSRKKTAR